MLISAFRAVVAKVTARTARLAALAALALAALAITPAAASSYVYWGTIDPVGPGSEIGRANPNGTGANHTFITGVFSPTAVAVDSEHLYWANYNSIGRADLDGAGVNKSFITGLTSPTALAVDSGHIYWASDADSTIGRANLDGSGINSSFITGLFRPAGVTVDAGHIYWASLGGTIGRANLDGSGVNQSFITTNIWNLGVAVDSDHVYWTSWGTIGRAKLDGSGVDSSFISSADAWSIAVDGRHIYWTGFGSRTQISRANLGGTSAGPIIFGSIDKYGIAADAVPVPNTEPPPPNTAPLAPNTTFGLATINRDKHTASFRFFSTQSGSSFLCRLDDKAFKPCSSPRTYRHLKRGRHTFRVKARNLDGAGDPSPAKRFFRL